MKLRQIALSIAAASAIAAAPAFAQSAVSVTNSDGSTTTYVSPPPAVIVAPDSSQPAIVSPDGTVVSPGYTYNAQQGVRNGYIVTEPGGMNPQERASTTPGTTDRATGAVTAPGYMGPLDSKGQ